MPFDLSDSVPIAVDIKDSTGALANAASVTLTITLPDGTTTTPTVSNPPSVTGQYRFTYTPTQVGRHAWRFVATTPNAAYQDAFEVRETTSPALLSLADVKAHLNITSTASDDELREFIEAATEVVESYVGPIVRRTKTARIRSTGYGSIVLPDTQIISITSLILVLDGSSPVNLLDLSINTEAGIVSLKNSLYGGYFPFGEYDITYVVGRTYVKPNWTLAAKIIVEHNWKSQLGNMPSIQGDDRGYVVTGSGYLVPYRALSLLEPDTAPVGFA